MFSKLPQTFIKRLGYLKKNLKNTFTFCLKREGVFLKTVILFLQKFQQTEIRNPTRALQDNGQNQEHLYGF